MNTLLHHVCEQIHPVFFAVLHLLVLSFLRGAISNPHIGLNSTSTVFFSPSLISLFLGK